MVGANNNYRMFTKGQKTDISLTSSMLLSGGREGATISGDSGWLFITPGYSTYDNLVTGTYTVVDGKLFVGIDGEAA